MSSKPFAVKVTGAADVAVKAAVNEIAKEREEFVRDRIEVYGFDKFQSFVKSWQFEFGLTIWFRRHLVTARILSQLDILTAICGFMSTVLYVISTYPSYKDMPAGLNLMEIILTWFF